MSDRETFKKELDERTKEVNALIEGYLPEEAGAQKTIFEAMNYSMRAGGKRLRPLFMQEMCRLFTGEVLDTVKPFMAAVEMIHTSSLVHDDLPCMDDDMMRRGKASTWAFIAVVGGDLIEVIRTAVQQPSGEPASPFIQLVTAAVVYAAFLGWFKHKYGG